MIRIRCTPLPPPHRHQQALAKMDLGMLQKLFERIRNTPLPPAAQPPASPPAPVAPPDGDVGDDGAQQSKSARKKPKLPPTPIVDMKDNSADFVVRLVDKALQLRLHSIRTGATFLEDITRFVKHCCEVESSLAHGLPNEGLMPSFLEVLRAIIVVFLCSCASEAGQNAPLPSAVREARALLNAEASLSKPNKVSAAMELHPGPRKAMDLARVIAATGLADQAADEQFNQYYDSLETIVGDVFETGFAEWILKGERGYWRASRSSSPWSTPARWS